MVDVMGTKGGFKKHTFINILKEAEVFSLEKKSKGRLNRYLIPADGRCYKDIDFYLM